MVTDGDVSVYDILSLLRLNIEEKAAEKLFFVARAS
jgi:hypothetical protein